MYCQKSITYKIKHEKHTIVNITNKDGEKKLEQRIVQGVKTTLMILNQKK